MCDSSDRAELLAEILKRLEETKASLESIENPRQLRIIRTNINNVLKMPREKSDAQKDLNRLAQRRFYARQRDKILERKRLKRNRATAD